MMKKELDGITIFWAVLGALLCASIIEAAASRLIARYEMKAMTEQIENNMKADMKAMQIEPWKLPEQGHPEVVPGKSVAECNALTGGVLNDQWKRCRSGYVEKP